VPWLGAGQIPFQGTTLVFLHIKQIFWNNILIFSVYTNDKHVDSVSLHAFTRTAEGQPGDGM
jgi:hypothetical protein